MRVLGWNCHWCTCWVESPWSLLASLVHGVVHCCCPYRRRLLSLEWGSHEILKTTCPFLSTLTLRVVICQWNAVVVQVVTQGHIGDLGSLWWLKSRREQRRELLSNAQRFLTIALSRGWRECKQNTVSSVAIFLAEVFVG